MDTLLDAVYATATRRAGWQVFVDELRACADVPVMMFGHDIARDESLGLVAAGIDPAEIVRYHEGFADKNPWMHMNLTMPVGSVGTSDEALARRDLFKTEFYNDWLRHQDNVVAGPFLLCQRTAERFVGLALACPAKRVDRSLPHGLELLQQLAPHVRRALTMAQAMSRGEVASYAHLRDSRHAVIVVRASGAVDYLNKAAEQLVASGEVVRITARGRLEGACAEMRSYLSAALANI